MTSTLFIVQIALALLITIVVLLQKSSSIGLGAYSGSNESMFGSKGPAGFLTKLTFALALLFVINTLAIGYFYTKASTHSVTDALVEQQTGKTSAPTAPSSDTTDTPIAPENKTIETHSDGATAVGAVENKQAPSAPTNDVESPVVPQIPIAQ